MAYGLTANGFEAKTTTDVRLETEAAWLSEFGPVSLSAATRNAQIIMILADRIGDVWNVAQSVYAALSPSAGGSDLDNVAALTGSTRKAATHSVVNETLYAAAGQAPFIDAGSVVSVQGSGERFVTVTPVTLPTGGSAVVLMSSVNTGPVSALAGTLTVIETPVAGWASASNAADAVQGRNVETDAAFRIRRDQERSVGSASVAAIRSKIAEIPTVFAVNVFENEKPTTDVVTGMPPNSIEAVVSSDETLATDDLVRAAIFTKKTAGVQTVGAIVGTVVDDGGQSHIIKFSREGEIDVYQKVLLTVNPSLFPVGGEALVCQALVDYGQTFQFGQPVVSSAMGPAVFAAVPGVIDAIVNIGLTASPATTATIPVGGRQVAKFDSSRIEIPPPTF